MRLLCGNVEARVEAEDEDHAWLRDYLSVEDPGAEFSSAFQAGHWDGRLRLYRPERATFPTGLVRAVVAAARKEGRGDVEVVDERGPAPGAWEEGGLGWLRDYQVDAVRSIRRRTRGIIKAPTGSGKTEMFVGLGWGNRTIPWVVLVDTRDLMHQAAERFEKRTREEAGVFGDGERRPRRFTVATLQTIHAGLQAGDPQTVALVLEARGLIVDEVHVLPAREAFLTAQQFHGAYWRAGVSATPLARGDARDFLAVGAIGPVVHEVSRGDLEARGLLARPRIVFAHHRVPKMSGTFQEVYEAGVCLDERRNALVVSLAMALPRPTIVFVRSINHGYLLARALGQAGASAEFIKGENSSGEREAAATRLLRGNIDVLVTTKVFNKGVDLPGLRGGVNAAGGASEIDALQRLGRLSRATEGKDSFVYADVLDDGQRWLAKHARERLAAYRDDGYEVEVYDGAASVAAALRAAQ